MIDINQVITGFLLTPSLWLFSLAFAWRGVRNRSPIAAGAIMFALWTIYRFVAFGSAVAMYMIVWTPVAAIVAFAFCFMIMVFLNNALSQNR